MKHKRKTPYAPTFHHAISREVEGLIALQSKLADAIERARPLVAKEREESRRRYYERCERDGYAPRECSRSKRDFYARKERERKSEDYKSRTGGFRLTRESVMAQGNHIRVCGMRSNSLHDLSWKF